MTTTCGYLGGKGNWRSREKGEKEDTTKHGRDEKKIKKKGIITIAFPFILNLSFQHFQFFAMKKTQKNLFTSVSI